MTGDSAALRRAQLGSDRLFDLPESAIEEQHTGSLRRRFVVPPFSVLDTRQGYWQDRKREWLSLGIRGERGRTLQANRGNHRSSYGSGYAASFNTQQNENELAVSVFDPVLCELAYLWFCPERGAILDPFAGGSVRGIVAAKMGRRYTGVDLSDMQVAENQVQARQILRAEEQKAQWIGGDSRNLPALLGAEAFDFVFSCPPYYDLEVYTNDDRDLSCAANYACFLAEYQHILSHAIDRLKEDRFMVLVVGDIRDKEGRLRPFISDTAAACEVAGAFAYNDMVLVNAVGTVAMRITKHFTAMRKVGKMHQRVLVFCKGDPKKATRALEEAA